MSEPTWRDITGVVEQLDRAFDIPAAIKELGYTLREWERGTRDNIARTIVFHLGARERYHLDPVFKAEIDLLAHMAWSAIFDGPPLDPDEQRKRITGLGVLLQYDTPYRVEMQRGGSGGGGEMRVGRKSGRLVADLPATQTNLTLGVNPGDVIALTNRAHKDLIEYIEYVGPHGQIKRGTGGSTALAWPAGTLWEVLDFTQDQEKT